MRIYRQLPLVSLLLIGTGIFAQNDTTVKPVKLTGFEGKRQIGVSFGAGISNFQVTNSNWKQGTTNYNDSLKTIASSSVFKFDLSILYVINFSKRFSFRPAVTLSFEGGNIHYIKPQSVETIKATTASEMLSLPFLFKYRSRSVRPYIAVGPSFLYMLGQEKKTESLLSLKTFDVLGDVGVGVDIHAPKQKLIVTPEIKYSMGLLNQKGTADNLYANTIEKLKRQALAFTIYLRDR